MRLTKYKYFSWIIISAITVVAASVMALVPGSPSKVLADPLPSCGGGSTLVPAQNGNPPYCSCPAGKLLVTGNPNTCADSCPAGWDEYNDSTGQLSCVKPATTTCSDGSTAPGGDINNCFKGDGNRCGSGAHAVVTSISLGCRGLGNPILDMLFGIIRFLSDGVGIVVVLSLIIAGVQYSAAGGDPNAAQGAIKRIRSSITALLIFIFSYAILNYVLPGAFLK